MHMHSVATSDTPTREETFSNDQVPEASKTTMHSFSAPQTSIKCTEATQQSFDHVPELQM